LALLDAYMNLILLPCHKNEKKAGMKKRRAQEQSSRI